VLSNWGSDLLELFGAEGSSSGGVEGFKDGLEGGLTCWVTSEAEDVEEGAEVEVSANSCGIDDGEDLSGLGLEIEGLDGVDELFSGDSAAAVVIEDVEDFL
jgi:hypothetical protein